MSSTYCEVALPVPLRSLFTYEIPGRLAGSIFVGSRVLVPFRNRAMTGVVVDASVRRPDPKLVALLAKAHDWFARLSSGRYDSVRAIARQEHVGSNYVTRVIYLAFLAPDIVQRIVRGEHPKELNADRVIRMVPLPDAWADQRTLFGSSS